MTRTPLIWLAAIAIPFAGCTDKKESGEAMRLKWEREAVAADNEFKSLVQVVSRRIETGAKPPDGPCLKSRKYQLGGFQHRYEHGVGYGAIEVKITYRRTETKQIAEWVLGTVHVPQGPEVEYDNAGNATFDDQHRIIGYYRWTADKWTFDAKVMSRHNPFNQTQSVLPPWHMGTAIAAGPDEFPFADYAGGK